MALIECSNLYKDFGGQAIFSEVTFSLHDREKVGLVGPNGSGKTSLVRLIMGKDEDYSGMLRSEPGKRFSYVPQRPETPSGKTALGYLLEDQAAIKEKLNSLEASMAEPGADHSDLLERYGRLREEYEAYGAEESQDRALRYLERAGLPRIHSTELGSLSGGELNVLSLLKALMGSPDILILDEPGNHLDLWGQAWLEDFLVQLPLAILLISHNRWLLDRVTSRTLSIEDGKIIDYSGNYSAARLERLKRAAAQGAGWQADEKKLERLEALVRRFEEIARTSFDPAWGKRLRARKSQLARERESARERPDVRQRAMNLDFGKNDARSTYALIVSNYSKAFGDTRLVDEGSFDILGGEKVALVGKNGSGKTSFIRDLVRDCSWEGETIRVSPSMRIGYLSQGQDSLDAEQSVVGTLEALGGKPEEVRKLLKKFLFEFHEMDRKVSCLSGGELNRLQLAKAVFQKANFLILDEPTNHLDIQAREAVEEALSEFDGTVLVVSHDRYFLEKITERVVEINEGKFIAYEGGFSEYWRDLGMPRAKPSNKKTGILDRAEMLKELKSGLSGLNPSTGKNERGLIEKIENLEKQKADLEIAVVKAIETKKFAIARNLSVDIERISKMIEKAYADWCAQTH
jgi:ATPase subunit of ABC transporter with duplicated ATPase domains